MEKENNSNENLEEKVEKEENEINKNDENILEEINENENQKNDENVLNENQENVLEELPNPNNEVQNEIKNNENIKDNMEKIDEENKENDKKVENIKKQEINNNVENHNQNKEENAINDKVDNKINEKENNVDNNLNMKQEENILNENNANVLEEINKNNANVLEEVNENNNNILEENNEEKNKILDKKNIIDNEEEENEKVSIKRNLPVNDEYNRSIKVILLGDSNVGKSSLINRLINNNFTEQQATIAIESHSYTISFNEYLIRMQIWDTAGQEKFNSIVSNYYKGTDVGIFIYSIDIQDSFNNVKEWFKILKENTNENSINVLLGNKTDLEDEKRTVTYEQGEKFATENEFMLYREISCKSKDSEEIENIMEVFDEIGKYFYNIYKYRCNTNSFDMNYVATPSMIDLGEKQRKKNKNHKGEKKKCCSK